MGAQYVPVSQQLAGCSGVSVMLFGWDWYKLHAAAGLGFWTQEVLNAAEPGPGGRPARHSPAIHLQAAETAIKNTQKWKSEDEKGIQGISWQPYGTTFTVWCVLGGVPLHQM